MIRSLVLTVGWGNASQSSALWRDLWVRRGPAPRKEGHETEGETNKVKQIKLRYKKRVWRLMEWYGYLLIFLIGILGQYLPSRDSKTLLCAEMRCKRVSKQRVNIDIESTPCSKVARGRMDECGVVKEGARAARRIIGTAEAAASKQHRYTHPADMTTKYHFHLSSYDPDAPLTSIILQRSSKGCFHIDLEHWRS